MPFSVRLQFFRTFILLIFDYCLLLVCYFTKTQIQRLANCYNACLFKLFRLEFSHKELDEINHFFEEYKLFGFQHRIVLHLSLFSHKIINIPSTLLKLKEYILFNSNRNIQYNLPTLYMPKINNHYGELTLFFIE